MLCADGSRDITITASHIQVTGIVNVGVSQGGFDVKLTNQSVQITGFAVNLGGVPGEIVGLLHLDTALGPIIGWATETFVVPVVNRALAGLNATRTVDVLGTPVDVSDDAVNQLLGSLWAAGGMDKAFALDTGSYGTIGTLYDRIELSARVPPFVDASGGSLKLTIGGDVQ